jgi:LuxR family maltose regulon positive regulatory protein
MPLLHSKLLIPDLPATFVERPRLQRLLDGADGPVTLVSAPAGWGKTVLLSAWARRRRAGAPVAWLSVEPEDNCEKFWSYVEAALADPQAGTAEPLPDPVPEIAPVAAEADARVARLADELARRRRAATLVLDDLHHLDDEDVLQGLEFLVRHAAGRLRLVLATRTDPSGLPLHRWRLRGDLTSVGIEALALTIAETAQVLTRHGLVLPDAYVHALRAEAEGWPGGLRLAALFLQEHSSTLYDGREWDPERTAAAAARSDPRVAEYLLAEVVLGRAAEVREILVRTSVVDRLCADLVDALTGRRDGEAVLAELRHTNAFVQALPAQPGWYRYHRLFREVLRAQLRQWPPSRIAELHRRAARWLGRHDLTADAVRHALAGHDWGYAADLLRTNGWSLALRGPAMLGHSDHFDRIDHGDELLPDWVSGSITDRTVRTAPDGSWEWEGRHGGAVALAVAAWHLDRHDVDRAEPYLCLAEQHQDGRQNMVMTAAFRLAQAQLAGSPSGIAAAARRLLDCSAIDESTVDGYAAAVASAALGAAQLNLGDPTAAEASLRDGRAWAQRAGLDPVGRSCDSRLAFVAAVRGHLRSAEALARAVLGPRPDPAYSPDWAFAHLALAVVALERAQLRDAETDLALAAGLADVTCAAHWCCGHRRAEPMLPAWIEIVRARLLGARGELAGGFAALRAGRAQLDEAVASSLEDWFIAAEAELRTSRGDTATVRMRLAPRVESGAGAPGFVAVALARALLRDGEPAAASLVLPAWTDDACGHLLPMRLDAGLIEALAAARLGESRRAARSLERVLELAEPDGFRRAFLQGGEGLRDLLLEHLDSGTAYWSTVTELIGATGATSPSGSERLPATVPAVMPAQSAGSAAAGSAAPGSGGPASATWRGSAALEPAAPVEPLTERELTVLRYLQSILSLVEIAAELSVSINTVKTHVRSIYRKLAAPRRRDAVRRARELHLL